MMSQSPVTYHYHTKPHFAKNQRRLLFAVWWLRRRYREFFQTMTRVDEARQGPHGKELIKAALRLDPHLSHGLASLDALMEQQGDAAEDKLGQRLKRTDELLALEARVRVSDERPLTDEELGRIYRTFEGLLKATCFKVLSFHAQHRAPWMQGRAPLPTEKGLFARASEDQLSVLIYTGALRAIAPVGDIPLYIGSTYPFDEFDQTLIGLPPRES